MKTLLSLLTCLCAANLNAQVQLLHLEEPATAPQLSSVMNSLGIRLLATALNGLFFSSAFLFSSCEKPDLDYMDEPYRVEIAALQSDTLSAITSAPQEPFSFSLVVSHCLAGGMCISVDIENPKNYTFLWEVNGSHGGHDISTRPCLCGESAKVWVMRLADGTLLSRSVALAPCANRDK